MLQLQHCTNFFLKLTSGVLALSVFLFYAAFAMAILDLISGVHFASFVDILPKYLKYFTFPVDFDIS
jgi:hypothetical protein